MKKIGLKKTKEEIVAITQLKEQKRRKFILSGNLWLVVISITLPLMLYAVINYASSIFDMVMASNMDKSTANSVTSVALVGQIKSMLSSIGGGLAAGGSIIIAREIGRNHYEKARSVTTTVLSIVFTVALLILIVTIPFARGILLGLGVPKNIIEVAAPYFILEMVAVCISMLNQVFLSVEKARGATRLISLLNFGVIAVKILFSLLFVKVFNIKDIWCLSLASVIATSCLTVYMLITLLRPGYIFRFSLKVADFKKKTLLPIFKISFPIFLGKFIFSFGKVQINRMAGDYYDKDLPDNAPTSTTSALGISNNLGGAVTNILNSFEDSESSIISQNLGNKNIRRAINTFYVGLALNLLLAIFGVILVTIFNDQLVGIFTSTPEAFELVSEIFQYEKLGIIMLAVNASVMGLLYGFGYTKVSMVLNLARVFVFRIPTLWLLYNVMHIGREAVGMAMMISNICIGCMSSIAAIVVIAINRKKIKLHQEVKDLI